MGHACIAFQMQKIEDITAHWKLKAVEHYGDRDETSGNWLYTWDDGERTLCQCTECGGYVLIQASEFHSFSDAPDSYYEDYFPVDGAEEARRLNRELDGWKIESEFGKPYLMRTNGRLCWSEKWWET